MSSQAVRRTGFTLIELLVVIATIAFANAMNGNPPPANVDSVWVAQHYAAKILNP